MVRLVIPLLVLILAVVALACDGGGGGSPTAAPTPTTAPTPAEPTPTSTPADAIRITTPEDRFAFVDELGELEIVSERCVYDADAVTADCGENGLYELEPALPQGEETEGECNIFLVEGEPVALSCATGITAVLYEIP